MIIMNKSITDLQYQVTEFIVAILLFIMTKKLKEIVKEPLR